MSIGNAGNNLDGQLASAKQTADDDDEFGKVSKALDLPQVRAIFNHVD